MTLRELEARVKVLEDIEAIKKLKASYCYTADAAIAGDMSKWDEFLGLYAQDAKVDFTPIAKTETRDELVKFFTETLPSLFSFLALMLSNPIIEVNGDKATGVWYVLCPCTFKVANVAGWIHARYDEEYVREKGHWKFKFIRGTFTYCTTFEEGWVKAPFTVPGLV